MTLALSLLDAGIADVDIYESAPAIKELGVGFNLQPHAVRELTELGLLDALLAVGMLTTAADQPMPRQDWDHTARLTDALQPFASFVFDFLDAPALIRGAEAIYQYPMVDRDPLPTWDFGRVTLLGDAAHPMYPQGGNGASQAIVDARVLARELAINQSVQAAVAAYDANRR